jgi:ankyrin repeat protein
MRMFRQSSGSNQGHLVLTQFDAYQDGVLTEAEMAAFCRHLNACEACRMRLESQIEIARRLAGEASPQAALSPAAVARIQQNVFSRMRRALIMNNVRAVTGATAAVAVLTLIVIFFVWQSRVITIVGIGGQLKPDLAPASQVVPEVEEVVVEEPVIEEPAVEVDAEPQAIVEPVTDAQLFEAVSAADAAAVEELLAAGANPDAVKPSGYPILKQAVLDSIKNHNTEIVTLLVENGANVNQLDGGGQAVLPLAAGASQFEVVQLLLKAGADPNGTSSVNVEDVGMLADAPALTHAILANNLEVVQLLIDHGADLALAESGAGLTPLHVAASLDRARVIEILLANGANPDPPGNKTPLHIASEIQKVRSAQVLLDGDANPNAQTERGKTALMYAVSLGQTPQFGSTGIVTVLLEGGADPNLADENGKTVLHYAAAKGKDDAMRILIAHGASMDLQDNDGNTALHSAARSGRNKGVSVLIELGAAVDLQNAEGQTPLDVAKNEPVAELLREAGAGE